MNQYRNKYNVSRNIPAHIKMTVRYRCKFGCVMCRSGFYQYEHIDSFSEVREHNPDKICCLCASCHDRVTRGQLSKMAVEHAYREIWRSDPDKVSAPRGPLDYHSGNADLVIGGFKYSPLINRILCYHGEDLFRIEPNLHGLPGSISAKFFNNEGVKILELNQNEWIGETTNWDIEVVGQKINVRNPDRRLVLSLRLKPPSSIVIQRLDMRCGDAHILISDKTYAIGRYCSDQEVIWLHARMNLTKSTPVAVGFEFASPEILLRRSKKLENTGQSLHTSDNRFIMGSPLGVVYIPLGISIGYGTSFHLMECIVAKLPLSKARRLIWKDPEGLAAALRKNAE